MTETPQLSRYFRHVDGFQDGTQWMRVDPDGKVFGRSHDGRTWQALNYTPEDCFSRVSAGIWQEIIPKCETKR